jgi:hypothetical protein
MRPAATIAEPEPQQRIDDRPAGAVEPGAGKRGEAKVVRNEETCGRGRSMAIEASADGGESEMLATVGIAGAVLALGLVAGFGLRRLLRSE